LLLRLTFRRFLRRFLFALPVPRRLLFSSFFIFKIVRRRKDTIFFDTRTKFFILCKKSAYVPAASDPSIGGEA
jgi:hypothetical protein